VALPGKIGLIFETLEINIEKFSVVLICGYGVIQTTNLKK